MSIPSSVPPEAADLILKALNVIPEKRISSREFLEHPWFAKNGLLPPWKLSPQVVSPTLSNQDLSIRGSRRIPGQNPLMTQMGLRERSASREVSQMAHTPISTNLSQASRTYIQPSTHQPDQYNTTPRPENSASTTQQNFYPLRVITTAEPQPVSQLTTTMHTPQSTSTNFNLPPQALSPMLQPVNYAKDYTNIPNLSDHDSKHNLSTDVVSNGQSGIKKGNSLRLRSNSREPELVTNQPPIEYHSQPLMTPVFHQHTDSNPTIGEKIVITSKPNNYIYVPQVLNQPPPQNFTNSGIRQAAPRDPSPAPKPPQREVSPAPSPLHSPPLAAFTQRRPSNMAGIYPPPLSPQLAHSNGFTQVQQPQPQQSAPQSQHNSVRYPSPVPEAYRPLFGATQRAGLDQQPAVLPAHPPVPEQSNHATRAQTPTVTRIRTSDNVIVQTNEHPEVAILKSKLAQAEAEINRLKTLLGQSAADVSNLQQQVSQLRSSESAIKSQLLSSLSPDSPDSQLKTMKAEILKFAQKLKEQNPTWYPNIKTDLTLFQSVLAKATQSLQNESSLSLKYNDLRKKYGLARYCLVQYGESAKQLQQASHKVLYSQQAIGDIQDLANCMHAYQVKIQALEESPEFAFVVTDT